VLDGEIVRVDEKGKPQFRDLMFHRGNPCFFLGSSCGQEYDLFLVVEQLTNK